MLDLIRQVLEPAGVRPPRRTTELTVAMLQLVASGRGVAALPLSRKATRVRRWRTSRIDWFIINFQVDRLKLSFE
jgi:DNA-binding transcriptional LysR family regulator